MSVTDLSTDLSVDQLVGNVVFDYGDQALMLQCGSTAEVLAWAAALRAAALPGVVDIVPAARTVLVKLDGPRYQGVTRQRLRKLRVTAEPIPAAPADRSADVVIDVVYDGPDLAEVADHTGLTTAQVINAHTVDPVASRIQRVRTGFRVPGRRRPTPAGAAPLRAADRRCRPARSPSPANSARSIHVNRPAAGSSSATPMRSCGISSGPIRRC